MIHKTVAATSTFESWRAIARECITAGMKPSDIIWSFGTASHDDLFAESVVNETVTEIQSAKVPKLFLELAQACVCHSDPERFALLYELLTDCIKSPHILENAAYPLVSKISSMCKSVRRDKHKMKAFVRFNEDHNGDGDRRKFIAWFEPEHFIVEETSSFFMRRFSDMDWCIATPKGTAIFANGSLSFNPEPARHLELSDVTESLWKTYYANIFNPARVKLNAMRSEMPKKYWHNMPEAALIPELVANAERRVMSMQNANPTTPAHFSNAARAKVIAPAGVNFGSFLSLDALNDSARKCQRCPLHCNATQTVVGEGSETAHLMIVGEQPGDEEDLSGRPFVGPSGKLLDQGLSEEKIERKDIYVTNAVKHFKFEPRGKRRIHQKPNAGEIQHCKYWLVNEVKIVRPKLILAMGATAIGALTGSDKNVTARRGQIEKLNTETQVLPTFHPAAILRMQDPEKSDEMKRQFYSDLKQAKDLLVQFANGFQ
jgi:uracil-DNA glycosylase